MKTKAEILEGLGNFYCTQNYWKFSPLFRNLVLTDGMQYLCESAQSFWLVDIVGSILCEKKTVSYFKRQSPVSIRIKLNGKGGATVSVGNEKKPFYVQEISYTDFPLQEFEFYVGDNGDFFVAMIPSEN